MKILNGHIFVVIGLIITYLLQSCKSNEDLLSHEGNLVQIGTLKNLLDGNYDGTIKLKTLKKYGNCGVGTFDKIDGEMIILNDTVFQCLWDGSVKIANNNNRIPFADVAMIYDNTSIKMPSSNDIEALSNVLNKYIDDSKIYMAIFTGHFNSIEVRSELAQTKPYKPLNEVMKTDQRMYCYKNINGTLVALYTPQSMAENTGSGWHFHFISDDRTKGGHVLSLSTSRLKSTSLTKLN